MEVGGPRADFASLLLTFGARPAYGPAKMTRHDAKMTKNDQKAPQNHQKSTFFGFDRVLTAV